MKADLRKLKTSIEFIWLTDECSFHDYSDDNSFVNEALYSRDAEETNQDELRQPQYWLLDVEADSSCYGYIENTWRVQ